MTFYESLKCPLPGCDSDLHLIWENSRALYTDDLDEPPSTIDLHSTLWRVGCEEGHVLLLPAPIGAAGEVDESDDCRTFRRYDGERLRRLLGQNAKWVSR